MYNNFTCLLLLQYKNSPLGRWLSSQYPDTGNGSAQRPSHTVEIRKLPTSLTCVFFPELIDSKTVYPGRYQRFHFGEDIWRRPPWRLSRKIESLSWFRRRRSLPHRCYNTIYIILILYIYIKAVIYQLYINKWEILYLGLSLHEEILVLLHTCIN